MSEELQTVVEKANYYRNIDNIAPWNYHATDIDLGRTKDQQAFGVGDWNIGEE